MRAVSTVVVALLAVGVWWLQQGDSDGGDRRSRPQTTASGAPSSAPTTRSPTEAGGDAGAAGDESGIAYVDLSALPPEAAETVALIDEGGPFPYPGKDGSTFGNFEGLLPAHERGYYAEYTVPTPGESDRGARRIIAGEGGELYWTEDHYESFERIRR